MKITTITEKNDFIIKINDYLENKENNTTIDDILHISEYSDIDEFKPLSTMLYEVFSVDLLDINDEFTYTYTQIINGNNHTIVCWTFHPFEYACIEEIAEHVYAIIENNRINA